MKALIVIAASAVMFAGLSGCGRMGELERPGTTTERAMRSAWDDPLVDPATVNRPSSQVPIDGGPNNLVGGTAAGAEPQ